jgi:hypothetical protein
LLDTGGDESVEEAHDGPQYPSPENLAALQPVVQVGVTGHRNLADPARAGVLATEALCLLLSLIDAAKWPVGIRRSADHAGTRVGYRIISPLAEGGDRVAAALVRDPEPSLANRTRELVVPLPFKLAAYRGHDGQPGTDCLTSESQAQFDDLSADAKWIRALHSSAPAGDQQRADWYSDVGDYVVAHCDFLLAFWDGCDNGKESGTADIIKRAISRHRPVIWIPVARREPAASSDPLPNQGETQLLTSLAAEDGRPLPGPELNSPEAVAVISGRGPGSKHIRSASGLLLERFGRLAKLLRYAQEPRVARDIAEEMPASQAGAGAGTANVKSVAEWIVPAYVIADGLAKQYQTRLKYWNIGVYAGATVAVILGALAAIVFPYGGLWRLNFVLEALILVGLFTAQVMDVRRKYRDQWVAFRAMGEYFRSGRFLALVTPGIAVGLDFSRLARLQLWSAPEPVSVPWFTPVLERVWEQHPTFTLRDADASWLGSYLAEQWIGDQMCYHRRRAAMHGRWEEIFQWVIRGILAVTVLIVLSHVVYDYASQPSGAGDRDLVPDSLAFFTIALTSLASAFTGYSGLQRHAYHAARFERMLDELSRIKKSMAGAMTLEQVMTRARAARRIMLGETINWYEEMEQQVIDSPS